MIALCTDIWKRDSVEQPNKAKVAAVPAVCQGQLLMFLIYIYHEEIRLWWMGLET